MIAVVYNLTRCVSALGTLAHSLRLQDTVCTYRHTEVVGPVQSLLPTDHVTDVEDVIADRVDVALHGASAVEHEDEITAGQSVRPQGKLRHTSLQYKTHMHLPERSPMVSM